MATGLKMGGSSSDVITDLSDKLAVFNIGLMGKSDALTLKYPSDLFSEKYVKRVRWKVTNLVQSVTISISAYGYSGNISTSSNTEGEQSFTSTEARMASTANYFKLGLPAVNGALAVVNYFIVEFY